MIKLLDYIRSKFKVYSPSKEWPDIEKLEYIDKKTYEISIIPVDKDKQVVKILEGRNVVIQFDSILSEEYMKQIKEDIQKQIKENGFAVVDGRCKIVEFDNPKAVIETK